MNGIEEKSLLFTEVSVDEAATMNGGRIAKSWYQRTAVSTAIFAARTYFFGFSPVGAAAYVLMNYPPTIEVH